MPLLPFGVMLPLPESGCVTVMSNLALVAAEASGRPMAENTNARATINPITTLVLFPVRILPSCTGDVEMFIGKSEVSLFKKAEPVFSNPRANKSLLRLFIDELFHNRSKYGKVKFTFLKKIFIGH